ncbi:ion transporter [Ornithinibacillus sp. 4-3]|uniref:Ion transporter n=1 Tax=Ornithinibacillus sp. 4-3 TaxID=3231488 RepID=A0AB39HPR1_9BACI
MLKKLIFEWVVHIKLKRIIEHPLFSKTILVLIMLNAVIICLETYPNIYKSYSHLLIGVDRILLLIFTVEILLKLFVYRSSFFRNGWNILDFIVISLSLIFIHSNFITILRIVRVLRVLRTLSMFPSLRRLINALFLSIPAMGSTILLTTILFYIYGIFGTTMFANAAPEYFGNFHSTILTLFQIFTLDSWATGIFRPLLSDIPWAWLYFVTFVLSSAFILANLFFGELVNNAHRLAEAEKDPEEDGVYKELKELKAQNQELHRKVDQLMEIMKK